ncbi:MAG: hypothetical protein AB7F86_12665 [Bdellovibrionales bacterium]
MMARLLRIILISPLLVGFQCRADIETQTRAFHEGDYVTSFSLLKSRQKLNEPTDLKRLALHYALGRGTKRNEVEAELLILKAAKAEKDLLAKLEDGVESCPQLKIEAENLINVANAILGEARWDPQAKKFAERLMTRAKSEFQYKKGICPAVDNFGGL